MDQDIEELYNKSDKKDKALILRLLFLSPNVSYRDLTIIIDKYKNNDESFVGEILALCDDDEIDFIYRIIAQIPQPTLELWLDIIIGIRRVKEGISVEDYIKLEYNKIMNEWHKNNPQFNMPNGVITLSVNGETTFVKVGDNPDIDENSLYDIASITKLYTEVILFRMVKENKYGITLDTKLKNIKLASGKTVHDLYPQLNLKMTIRDLISFNNKYITNYDIRNLNNREDALAALRTVYIDKTKEGEYLYTDLPIMVLTDLLEQTTGKDYRTLLNEYIIKPLGLRNTFMDLDEKNQARYTGLNKNGVNDPKSNIIGGGGHAGIITDGHDLIKFLSSIFEPGFIFDGVMDPMLLGMLGINKTVNGRYAINGKILAQVVEEVKNNLQILGISEAIIETVISQIKKSRESGVSTIGNLNVAAEGIKTVEFFKRKKNTVVNVTDDTALEQVVEEVKNNLRSLGILDKTIDEVEKQIEERREIIVSTIGNWKWEVAKEGFDDNDYYVYDGLASQIMPYKGFMVQGSTRVQGDVADFVIGDGYMIHTATSILIDIHNQYDNIKAANEKGLATKEYYVEGKGMMKMADARKAGLGYFGGYYDQLSNMLSIARIMEIYSQYKKLNKKKVR